MAPTVTPHADAVCCHPTRQSRQFRQEPGNRTPAEALIQPPSGPSRRRAAATAAAARSLPTGRSSPVPSRCSIRTYSRRLWRRRRRNAAASSAYRFTLSTRTRCGFSTVLFPRSGSIFRSRTGIFRSQIAQTHACVEPGERGQHEPPSGPDQRVPTLRQDECLSLLKGNMG